MLEVFSSIVIVTITVIAMWSHYNIVRFLHEQGGKF